VVTGFGRAPRRSGPRWRFTSFDMHRNPQVMAVRGELLGARSELRLRPRAANGKGSWKPALPNGTIRKDDIHWLHSPNSMHFSAS
jgi:hypothetical protein